eukprot:TRINITY_DN1933_c0_g1_i2.p1 TRINITY_DN1933_c0_g1~~TRINITY_DN1933_c0_g1_i2.p1  ORF type:complete len:276 (+),score=69.39 TRINITY_DN1933_c0_g1_i2:92-919(+)
MAAKPGQEAYHRFRSWVAQQRITVDTNNTEKVWKYYDFGPKDVTPLVFLGGASATAEVFYRQFLSLCPKGYHLISVQFPSYMDHASWNKGFDRFLDKLGLKEVHLFGTSLGGYLAQSFAQYHPKRVASIILSNTFTDTSYYVENAPCAAMFPMMPEFMLKRMLLENLPSNVVESEIADSIDFMVHQLETMNQSEISSRMTLNCTVDPELRPIDLHLDSKVTILDTLDEVAIPEKLREEVYKIYPHAKVASLKTGGNFPFLSRSDEVNMHIQVISN